MNVGDYVRTPQGIIAKIINIQEDTEQYFLNGNAVSLESKNYIADKNITIGENFKHSPNIIDLIEVGDYVNGEQVSRIKQCPEYHLGDGILIFNEHNETIYSNFRTSKYYDIKSIVTHEQMKTMQYRVEE